MENYIKSTHFGDNFNFKFFNYIPNQPNNNFSTIYNALFYKNTIPGVNQIYLYNQLFLIKRCYLLFESYIFQILDALLLLIVFFFN